MTVPDSSGYREPTSCDHFPHGLSWQRGAAIALANPWYLQWPEHRNQRSADQFEFRPKEMNRFRHKTTYAHKHQETISGTITSMVL